MDFMHHTSRSLYDWLTVSREQATRVPSEEEQDVALSSCVPLCGARNPGANMTPVPSAALKAILLV